jgi:glycogen debranching enzyme
MDFFMQETDKKAKAETFARKARLVLESFNRTFWNEEGGYLYDYVDGDYKNPDIRPNQIYAISLPFPLLTKFREAKVFQVVENNLLTSCGLRSLNPSHKDYKPFYRGNIWSRNAAYHQGTVWSFLLGPYIDALIRVRGEEGKPKAQGLMNIFLTHLNEACVGSISEIFDGEAPHTARGCIAQAWGVGEILRVALAYNLLDVKKSTLELA